jgi:hypothetical protein
VEELIMHDIADPNRHPHAALLLLAEAMGPASPSGAIEAQERRGQQDLVRSELLPSDLRGTEAAFEELGFILGDVQADDPLFRQVTLPAGWAREASDHAMWSYIIDPLGRRRVSIFYKAVYYDRSAHAAVVTLHSYLTSCAWDNRLPVLDDAWATPAEVLQIAEAGQEEQAAEAARWSKQGAKDLAQEAAARSATYSRIADTARQ